MKYLIGFLFVILLSSINNFVFYYALDHQEERGIVFSQKIEHLFKLDYLAYPLFGRCDKDDLDNVHYFGCDVLQQSMNIRRSN